MSSTVCIGKHLSVIDFKLSWSFCCCGETWWLHFQDQSEWGRKVFIVYIGRWFLRPFGERKEASVESRPIGMWQMALLRPRVSWCKNCFYLLTMHVLPNFPYCSWSKVMYDFAQSLFFLCTHASKYSQHTVLVTFITAVSWAVRDMTVESSCTWGWWEWWIKKVENGEV